MERNIRARTNRIGNRDKTKYKCNSIEEFVNKLYEYICDNRCIL